MDERIERVCHHLTLGAPIFAILVAFGVQIGFVHLPVRELTLLSMGAAGLWCIMVPRMPALSHLALLVFAVAMSGLAYGLTIFAGFAFGAALLALPQLLLLVAALRFAAEGLQQRA